LLDENSDSFTISRGHARVPDQTGNDASQHEAHYGAGDRWRPPAHLKRHGTARDLTLTRDPMGGVPHPPPPNGSFGDRTSDVPVPGFGSWQSCPDRGLRG